MDMSITAEGAVTVTHERRKYYGRYWIDGPNLFVVCRLVVQGVTLGHSTPLLVARRVLLQMARRGALES